MPKCILRGYIVTVFAAVLKSLKLQIYKYDTDPVAGHGRSDDIILVLINVI